ncbi:HAD family hydrolase [Tissierella sp. MSJ-40]|uniref:HAD family hydrolase n=1 Tax=Tissierella simiarum TaxID=2841534 RepID=A0ABS6E396_9FIRM|nr:HAD family hydrolase [Tissierella simiarum]
MYKLIAIDLDGTLLDDKKRIPIENLQIVHELIDKGYEVVIATGRRYWSAKELTKDIKRHMTILANNGSIARNSEDDSIIIKKYLRVEDFKVIIEEGKRRGLQPIIHVDNYEEGYDLVIELDRSHESYHNYLSSNENRFKQVETHLELEDVKILAVVYVGNKETLKNFHFHINDRYPSKYSSHVIENIKIAEALLEIMNPLGSKWITLMEYAKEKGIKPEEIITIGDDNNDIEMIKNSGLGIAMKNSSPMVKKIAKIISEKDNNESGVAFELKRVLNI